MSLSWDDFHHFWFGSISLTNDYYQHRIPLWFFGNSPEFDRACLTDYAHYLSSHTHSEPDSFQQHLLKIILCDQVPRNAFRGTPKAYQYDSRAVQLALKGIENGLEQTLSYPERIFLYMPFQHAENLQLQEMSVRKFLQMHEAAPEAIRQWTALALKKAQEHHETIRLNGRFPHRDAIFKRDSV